MKVTRVSALCLLLVVGGVALAADTVDGTWSLNVSLGGGQGGTATFELTQGEDGQITGKYRGAVGEADVTGTVQGNEVEFSFESGQAGKISYKGTFEGDTMKGTCTYGQLGAGTFEGTRQKS